MQKQGSEFVFISSLLKNMFGKHFKVFHTLTDTANESHFLTNFHMCMYMYLSI